MSDENFDDELEQKRQADWKREKDQEDKERKIHEIENQIIIKQDDLKKEEEKNVVLKAKARELKKIMDRTKVDMSENNRQIKLVEEEMRAINEEIKALKKKMNLIV